MLGGCSDIPFGQQEQTEVVVRLGHARVEHERILEIAALIRLGIEAPVGDRECVVRVGGAPLDTQSLAKVRDRVLVAGHLDIGHAELIVGHLEALVEQRVIVAREPVDDRKPVLLGGLPLLLVHGNECEACEGGRVVGRDLERGVVLLDCVSEPAGGSEGVCEQQAEAQVVRVLAYGCDQVLDRPGDRLAPALLNLKCGDGVRQIAEGRDQQDDDGLDCRVEPANVRSKSHACLTSGGG